MLDSMLRGLDMRVKSAVNGLVEPRHPLHLPQKGVRMEVFSISTGVREGFQILVIRGELDELTAPELDSAIDGNRNGWPVLIDLSEIEFMSSAGLHVLLRDRERLAIVCPPG